MRSRTVSSRHVSLAVALSSCVGVVACADEGGDVVLSHGPYSVVAAGDGETLTLRRDGDVLLSFPSDAFQMGVVSALDPTLSYDPYWLEYSDDVFHPDPPPSLSFHRLTDAKPSKPDDRTLIIQQSYEGLLTARLEIHAEGAPTEAGARFRATLVPISAPPIAYMRLRPRAGAEEAFYGLGGWPDGVNHRGKLRPMQVEADLSVESANNELHVPVPLLIGTRGWGLFVESKRVGLFDVAREADDLVQITYGTAEASGEGLTFHLFGARHPLDVTKQYYEVTGYPLLPATWAYGPWIWRNESEDQAQVEDDIRKIRELDLATSAIWIDRPYATKVNTFDFEAARYSDAPAMIQRAHDAGLRMALWSTPYLEEGAEPLLSEARTRGYFPTETNLLLNKWGKPIDFTNPEAFTWWQSLIGRYTDLGIEGFKLDFAEDITTGVAGARTPWVFHDGSDERTMHWGYTQLYHRAYAEKLPASGGFLLCRAGRWGDQVRASVIWPGDLDATLTKYEEQFTNRGGELVKGVGGLPTAVIMSLNLGPSGFPFFGSDTGGYRHGPPGREVFTRWFQQTALSSVMQVGDSTSQPPWEFTPENGRDPATLDLYRTFARLHLRLFPYLWTFAKHLVDDGRPLTRALGLAYPELGEHPNDEYLFGDDLLVAPIVESGKLVREVILPPGEWVDWWTGVRTDSGVGGGRKLVADAPLDTLPLYVRAGALVPMLRPTIDTLSPVATSSAATIESWANDPGVLWARTTNGPDATFTVYDGTKLVRTGKSVAITAGQDYRQGVILEIFGLGAEPAAPTIDGVAATKTTVEPTAGTYSWEETRAGGTLTIGVAPGEHVVTYP